jgi:cytochrome c2
LIKVMMPSGGRPQAAASRLPLAFTTPLLKGEINPVDGQLYLVGFQVWGTQAKELAGLCRVRYTGAGPAPLPLNAAVFREGFLLSFPFRLPAAVATDPGRFGARSWNYRRTARYGSGQFREDGQPGADPLLVHSVIASHDRSSVFLATPGVRRAHQIEVSYQLEGDGGGVAGPGAVYLTAHELPRFHPHQHGFAGLDFDALFARDPAPRKPNITTTTPSPERGAVLYTTMGCVACHSIDGSTEGKTGPTWKSLAGSKRTFADGTGAVATDDYLRESILEPSNKVTAGFDPKDVGMPSYQGVLSEVDVSSIILFIQSLAGGDQGASENAPPRLRE